jgi:AraC family transcriptional regulator
VTSWVSRSRSGIGLAFLDSGAARADDQAPNEGHHVVLVQRRGVRQVGEVRVIPAGQRERHSPADSDGFFEITVPVQVLGNRRLVPRRGSRDPLLYAITERLAGLSTRDDDTATLIREGLGDVIRLHLRDYYTVEETPDGRDAASSLGAAHRRRLVHYVDDNLSGPIHLDQMAAEAQMTPADFRRAFPAAFGTTPHQFVIYRRIRRAREMLSDTRHSITEVGLAVGFSTPSHFATTFKQHTGLTPSAYRAAVLL